MIFETPEIEFSGLEPNYHLYSAIQEIADRIYWQSPGNSYLVMAFEKSHSSLKASCRVTSLAGVFVADAIGDCPEKCAMRLERDICRQLNIWKQNRWGFVKAREVKKARSTTWPSKSA